MESNVQPGSPVITASAFKLKHRLFGLFNHFIALSFEGRPGAILEFKLADQQHDNFLFTSEIEHLAKQLAIAFSLSDKREHQLSEFLLERSPEKELSWVYDDCYWTLKKSKDGFPVFLAATLSNEIKRLVEIKNG